MALRITLHFSFEGIKGKTFLHIGSKILAVIGCLSMFLFILVYISCTTSGSEISVTPYPIEFKTTRGVLGCIKCWQIEVSVFFCEPFECVCESVRLRLGLHVFFPLLNDVLYRAEDCFVPSVVFDSLRCQSCDLCLDLETDHQNSECHYNKNNSKDFCKSPSDCKMHLY